MIRTLLSALAIAALTAPALAQAPVDAEAAATACGKALDGHGINSPGRTVTPSQRLICFRGQINSLTVAPLVAAINGAPEESTLWVESAGGDTHSGLDIAEAVLRRHSTVVTGVVCGSSCANYIFMSAARRIVGKDSVVAFHGALDSGLKAQMQAALDAELAKPKPNDVMAQALRKPLAEWEGDMARQAAMLKAIGANAHFFDYHGGSAAVSAADRDRHARCKVAGYSWSTYSPAFLAANGIAVEAWNGPADQARLDALSRKRACWWE